MNSLSYRDRGVARLVALSRYCRVAAVVSLPALSAITGCGSGSGGSGTTGTLITVLNGGTVSSGAARLAIPASSITQDTQFTIASASGPAAPSGKAVVSGTVFDLGPTGTTFASGKEATLTITYGALPNNVNASNLGLYTVANGSWQPVTGSSVDTTAKMVSAKLAHLSTYGILGDQSVGTAAKYTVVDVGLLPGDRFSNPRGLSSDGRVVGLSFSPLPSVPRPFLWQNGQISALPLLPGDDQGAAYGVNASGTAVGYTRLGQGNYNPVVWDNGAVTSLSGSYGSAQIYAINDLGHFRVSDKLVMGGSTVDLPIGFAGISFAATSTELNNSDALVGVKNDTGHLVYWQAGSIQDLGLMPGFTLMSAAGISNNMKIAGSASNPSNGPATGPTQAFLYDGGYTAIPRLSGDDSNNALGVNDSGQVIGSSSSGSILTNNLHSRLYIYQNGQSKDLATLIPSNWHLAGVAAINNRGQILAAGASDGNTTPRTLLLNPP